MAPAHCIISSEGTYHTVKPTSVSPTFVDGERVWTTKGETFTPDCQITVGEFTAPIAEIVKPMNVAEITDWGIASRRLKDTNAAGREDAAREALAGARKVFAAGVECSEEVSALLNSLSLQ